MEVSLERAVRASGEEQRAAISPTIFRGKGFRFHFFAREETRRTKFVSALALDRLKTSSIIDKAGSGLEGLFEAEIDERHLLRSILGDVLQEEPLETRAGNHLVTERSPWEAALVAKRRGDGQAEGKAEVYSKAGASAVKFILVNP